MKEESGPKLPFVVFRPCVVNTNDDNFIFLIGHTEYITVAYQYNQMESNWTSLEYEDFQCEIVGSYTEYSCTFEKGKNLIFTAMESCLAIYNITSMKWSQEKMNYSSGLVTHVDASQETIFYIGSNVGTTGSDLLMVNRQSIRSPGKMGLQVQIPSP